MQRQHPSDLRPRLARRWREAPAVATPAVVARTTGFFYLTGGLAVAIGCLLLDATAHHRDLIALTAFGAAVTGIAILLVGRMSPVAHLLIVGSGIVLVAAQVLLADHGAASVALAATYMFALIDAAFLLTMRAALVILALVQVSAVVAMHHVGIAYGDVAIVAACALAITVVVAWLASLLDAVEEDPLTALANRRGFDRRLDEALRHTAQGGQLAVVLLDVDWFKSVNDARGHLGGDQALLACARAWRGLVPPGACLSRFGGDEFALLLPHASLGEAADLADRLRAATPDHLTVSAGVAGWQPGDSGSVLMSRADVALYQAKTSGRDRTSVYGDPERAASALETAIKRGELRLLYQPVVEIATGRIVGYEALVRWQHPTRGLVGPAEFIPDAERTGAIHALGAWLLDQVCQLVHRLPEPGMAIGVNASPIELRNPEYAAMVRQRLRAHHTPGHRIIVEVTEGAFGDREEADRIIATLCELRTEGILVALDDFGAGYSSLRRLENLPIDVLKTDGSLVAPLQDGREDAPILEAIATMARALGVRLVAEHVETQHQADVLRRLGYQHAQGYLFGRPQEC